MSNDPEFSGTPPRPWRWKRALCWTFGLPLASLITLFAYDEKVKPYDDLIAEPVVEVPEETNGALKLWKLWDSRPASDITDTERLSDIKAGHKPWDPAFFAHYNKGWENVQSELEEALAMPHWQFPPQNPGGKALFSSTFCSTGLRHLDFMSDDSLQRKLPHEALAIQLGLRQLTLRLSKVSTSDIDQIVVSSFQKINLRGICDWLAAGPCPPEDLASLLTLWKDDLPSRSSVKKMLLHDAARFRFWLEDIQTRPWVERDSGQSFWRSFDEPRGRLYLKYGITLNRYHLSLRWFSDHCWDTAPSLETSLYARYVENVSQKENGSWTRWLDANAHGKARSANSSGPEYYRAVLGSVIHRPLFSGRAMRVRIALEMHRLDHAGQYPETLHSLVPQYLEAVPEDPRTGGPLAWDPKAGVIYAAGENWKQQLPPFKNPDGRDHGGWLSDDTRYPGLRLKRPAPPL